MNKQKVKYLVIILVIILLGILIGKFWFRRAEPGKTNQTEKITRVQVSEQQLPERFPTNFPLEPQAQIVQNENVKIDNAGELVLQGRRQYVSAKSLAENLSLYKQYLKDNNWGIVSLTDQPEFKAVVGRKFSEGMSLSVNITQYEGNKTLVNTSVEYK